MTKRQIAGVSLIIIAFVISVNVFALRINREQEIKENGVANEEPETMTARSNSDVSYEEGGSFDINGKSISVDTGKASVSDYSAAASQVPDETYNYTGPMETISEMQKDMEKYAVVSQGVAYRGEQPTEDEIQEYESEVIKAAKTAVENHPEIYKSVLMALSYVLSNSGSSQQEYKYNNYFNLLAPSGASGSIAVRENNADGTTTDKTIMTFNDTDQCFDYMCRKLIKAGARRPKSFKGVVTVLYRQGYLSDNVDVINFYGWVKQCGGDTEFEDLSDYTSVTVTDIIENAR